MACPVVEAAAGEDNPGTPAPHLTVSTVPKPQILPILVVAWLVAGCEGMTPTQRGAVTGGALGTGIGMVAGGSFGQVVGAGLIGGAAGAIVGSATSNR
jgi:hypothetical protein